MAYPADPIDALTEVEAPLTEGEVRVTAEDWEGNVESHVVRGDDYVVVAIGRLDVVQEQKFKNGTVVITLKRSDR